MMKISVKFVNMRVPSMDWDEEWFCNVSWQASLQKGRKPAISVLDSPAMTTTP